MGSRTVPRRTLARPGWPAAAPLFASAQCRLCAEKYWACPLPHATSAGWSRRRMIYWESDGHGGGSDRSEQAATARQDVHVRPCDFEFCIPDVRGTPVYRTSISG